LQLTTLYRKILEIYSQQPALADQQALVVNYRIQLLRSLDEQLEGARPGAKSNSSSTVEAKPLLKEIVTLCKELLATAEGRSFDATPYEILLRIYYRHSGTPEFDKAWQLNQAYMDRHVIADFYRRFPSRPLAYLHFLDITGHMWLGDRDARDTIREYLLRINAAKDTSPSSDERVVANEMRVFALTLLTRVHRKVNQLNVVVQFTKELLELIKTVSDATGAQVYVSQWHEAALNLSEALHRLRQVDNARLVLKSILAKIPDDPAALVELTELSYEQGQLEETREYCNQLLAQDSTQQWAKARLGWLDALPYVTSKASTTSSSKAAAPADDEKLMFRAITGKNALLVVVEEQQKSLKKYQAEMANSVCVFPHRGEGYSISGASKYRRPAARAYGDYFRLVLGLGYGWYEFWIGKIEWALGEEITARDWWVRAAQWGSTTAPTSEAGNDVAVVPSTSDVTASFRSVAEPASLAALGMYYHTQWRTRGTELDRAAARDCYEAALKRYPQQRLAPQFVVEGEGDGAILLEAALPLLDILLDTAFTSEAAAVPDKKIEKKTIDVDDEEHDKDSENADEGDSASIKDRHAYKSAMNLLSQLSQARHHWALFKLGLCRMRSGEFPLAIAALQNYLRRVPTDATAWICLAHAYKRQGKYSAALRVVERVEQIFRNNSTAAPTTGGDQLVLLQAQYLSSVLWNKLGHSERAANVAKSVLSQLEQRDDAAAHQSLKTLSTIALCTAIYDKLKVELHEGRYSSARSLLTDAVPHVKILEQSAASPSATASLDQVALWKLIGDIHSAHYYTRDMTATANDNTENALNLARSTTIRHLKQGARAYLRATQLDRDLHSLYHDLAINYYWQARVLQTLPVVVAPRGQQAQAAPPSNANEMDVYYASQSEHLLMFDEAVGQVQRAIVAAPVPHLVSQTLGKGAGDTTTIVRYLTVMGIITSEYHHAVEAATWSLPPTLTHRPVLGADFAQRAFTRAIKLANALAVTSDGFYAPHAAYVWSNMLTHWLKSGVDIDNVVAAATHARNLDPTAPVPWVVLTTSRFSSKQGAIKEILRDELNNLEHALQLSPNIDYAVVALSSLVYRLHRGDEFSHVYSGTYSDIQRITAGLLHSSAVHLEKLLSRRGAHQAPTSESASVFNLLGLLYSRLDMHAAAGEQFSSAIKAWKASSSPAALPTSLLLLNQAQSLERQNLFKEASEVYPQLLATIKSIEGETSELTLRVHAAAQLGSVRSALLSAPSANKSELPLVLDLAGSLAKSATTASSAAALRLWVAKAQYYASSSTDNEESLDSCVSGFVAAAHESNNVTAWGDAIAAASTSVAVAILRRDSKLVQSRTAALEGIVDSLAQLSAKASANHANLHEQFGSSVHLHAMRLHSVHHEAYQIQLFLTHLKELYLAPSDHSVANQEGAAYQRSRRALQRAIHLAPWKLDGWVHLASDHAVSLAAQSKDASPLVTIAPLISQSFSMLSTSCSSWLDDDSYSPSHALEMQVQHDYVRFKRAVLLNHDSASANLSSDADVLVPTEITPEELEAMALAASEAEEAAQQGRRSTPGSMRAPPPGTATTPVALPAKPTMIRTTATTAYKSSRLVALDAASRLVHLAPWLTSGWVAFAACQSPAPSALSPAGQIGADNNSWPSQSELGSAVLHVLQADEASQLQSPNIFASTVDCLPASVVYRKRQLAQVIGSALLHGSVESSRAQQLTQSSRLLTGTSTSVYAGAMFDWANGDKAKALQSMKNVLQQIIRSNAFSASALLLVRTC
jgi:tetratricopeptide (TPR) repeat protein